MKSIGEETFALHLRAHRLDGWEREYRFDQTRRFRFDFAKPESLIAVEIEGGIWTKGRHSHGVGMEIDMRKYNLAASLGWRVLRFSTDMVTSGEAINTVKGML
jgi:very-short-patch-repair endonuclease